MRIETSKCILREWRDSDAQSLAASANNKKIFDNVRDLFPYPYTLEDANNWILLCKNMREPQTVFAIEVEGNAIGNIAILLKEDIFRFNAEIGYFLDESYWGRGIISESIKAVTSYAFYNFSINRVYAEPFEMNVGSCRALEKAGFKKEAVFRKNVVKNGVLLNSCIYSVLSEDYI